MGFSLSPLRSLLPRRQGSTVFLLIVVLAFAVGLGANAAIFSIVNGVLIRPLPYFEPDRLVGVWHRAPGLKLDRFNLSNGTYLLYRRENRVLEDLGLYSVGAMNLAGGAAPERLDVAWGTGSAFTALRVPAALGRTIQEEDERPGAEKVVVLSSSLWRQRFGGDKTVVGTILRLDGVDRRVVGVMPAEFRFPNEEAKLWLPIVIDPAGLTPQNFNYKAVGRLRLGVTPERAARELSALVWRLPEVYGDSPFDKATLKSAQVAITVVPFRQEVVGSVEQVLWVLLVSAGCILLIACANVANLFLARAEGMQREVAVRTALGATRGSIAWLFLSESLVLSLAGGLVGLVLAEAGVRLLVRLQPKGIPRLAEVGIDSRVLLFTLLLSLLAGLLCGGLAAMRSAALTLVSALKEGGRGGMAGRGHHRVRRALVVAQVSLAQVLLVNSGLMVKSFERLRGVDPGFAPENVLVMQISLPDAEYADTAAAFHFFDRLVERVRALPGVMDVGIVSPLPLSGSDSSSGYSFADFPQQPGGVQPMLANRFASPGYFASLGIPLIEGRVFSSLDPLHKTNEVVVSRALAAHFWPNQSALGKRLTAGDPNEGPWYTIVGVVGDVRDRGLEGEPVQAVYFPMLRYANKVEWVPRGFSLAVRGRLDPAALVGPVRTALKSIDPNLPAARVEPLKDVVARSVARTAFTMFLLALAAGVAVLLGSIGLYAVIAYVVAQRTREIGVRMALGAGRGDILRMVLREGLTVAMFGIGIGLAGALALTRSLHALLYGISPADPATFMAVSALLAGVALLASWLPASRAAATEPLEAIRHD